MRAAGGDFRLKFGEGFSKEVASASDAGMVWKAAHVWQKDQ